MAYGWYYSKPKKSKNRIKSEVPKQRIKFGQTWWGQQWLNSLTHIDFDNRLPRGRAYAGNGSVKDIIIINNSISARVQGSRPSPYKVKINIPQFSVAQKKNLIDEIAKNPLILSKLLNREIPEELNRLALNSNIRIFPGSWKDFGMDCSCPDWAVPCKHLAAVIYIIANEIDVNPFTLFKLRGLDLIASLEQYHASISEHKEEQIPLIDSFLVDELPELQLESNFFPSELPDFTVITDQTEKIFTLLPPNPLFYTKDFKPLLQSVYKKISVNARKREQYELNQELRELMTRIETFDDTMILLDENLVVENVVFIKSGRKKDQETRLTWENFEWLIDSLDPAILENCNNALRGIALHRQFSIALASQGAFIPQLLIGGDSHYLVRWIPAENDPQIRILAQMLQKYTSPGTIWIWDILSEGEQRYMALTPDENARTLTSLFLESFFGNMRYDPKFKGTENDVIVNLFFNHKPYTFQALTEKQIPNTIQLWLKRLHLTNRKWQAIIRVEEKNAVFTLDILANNTEAPTEAPVPLKQMISDKKNQSISIELLRDLSSLTDFFPGLDHYIRTSGMKSMVFDGHQFAEVFQKILPTLRMLGIEILMPKALGKLLVPRPSLRLTAKTTGKTTSFLGLDQILGFDYQIAIGDRVMSVEEFQKLTGRLSGIVKIKDQYVLLNGSDMEKIFNPVDFPTKLSSQQLLKVALAEEYQGATIGLDAKVRKLIKKMSSPSIITIPKEIKATLRPYQLNGFRWMVQQSKIGFGSLIADDMGLGKTLQVIALLQKFKNDGLLNKEKALVVVPTTLLTNWLKELEKFAPSLHASVYHGLGRKLDLSGIDILLTTYGMVRSDLKTLKGKSWYVVVIDEAQNIKNTDSEQTKAVKSIKSTIRIAMSGTPVENRLSEYWSIMDFVYTGYLGPAKTFTEEFAEPIQVYHDKEKAGLFRKITAPFILRRLKTDQTIISDLPEKFENNQYCILTNEQAGLYQNVVDNALKSIEDMEGIQRRGLVLKMITALKQICNHPDNYLKKGNANPAISGKSQILMELLDNIHEAGEKTLLFTQYREMGDILVSMIENRFGFTPLFLHGGITRKNRDELVEDFQNKRNHWVFILSLKAGGTGLNLTSANHVIHHDFWWNPAVENQATDRAYRIGQDKNVMVSRLLTRGTFEEKIDEMLNSKKELANLTVSSGEKWIGDLSNMELKEIFRLK
ncbi:MAG: SNF2-related protein [Bacteroidales bacterium]|nr:SNF2-related protein [Bacteroidales bacterium]